MSHLPAAQWWRPELALEGPQGQAAVMPGGLRPGENGLPFWTLMAFTFVLLVAPQTVFPALAPFRIALCLAALGTAAYLWDRFIRRRPVTILTREIRLTAGLACWALITAPFSYWPGGSVSFFLGMYGKTLVVFWLLSNTLSSSLRLRQVAWGLSLMSVPLAATGIRNFLSGSFVPTGDAVKRILGYEAPLTGNPNDLALMLNLLLPLTVALFLIHRRPAVRVLLAAFVGLDVIAVIATFSRGGFLTLAAIFAMYVWRLRWRPERVWAAAALVVALLSVPLLPSGYVQRLGTILRTDADPTGSAQSRRADMLEAVEFVARHPIIGSGVGMDVLALNEQRGVEWKAVHNAYLQYAVELGLPGIVLFVLLLAACIKSTMVVQMRCAPVPALRALFYLAEGIQISLFAFAVAALFHPVAYQFYFYYVAGLAVAIKVVGEKEARAAVLGWNPSSAQ